MICRFKNKMLILVNHVYIYIYDFYIDKLNTDLHVSETKITNIFMFRNQVFWEPVLMNYKIH